MVQKSTIKLCHANVDCLVCIYNYVKMYINMD